MHPPINPQYILFGGTFVLANKLQYVGDKHYAEVSLKQWFLLRTLSDMPKTPSPTISQLAAEMDATRQNTAKMLGPLQAKGYVSLASNPADKRSQSITLTPLGMQCLQNAAAQNQGFLTNIFANIPPQNIATAAQVLVQMVQNLERMKEDEPT